MQENLTVYATSSGKHKVSVSVKDVKLVRNDNDYALDITYIADAPDRVEELHIPRVVLPINPERVRISETIDDHFCGPYCPPAHIFRADLGFGSMPIELHDGAAFTIKTIKEKTKEMTLEEIEKKLGHKVKIISKEETK